MYARAGSGIPREARRAVGCTEGLDNLSTVDGADGEGGAGLGERKWVDTIMDRHGAVRPRVGRLLRCGRRAYRRSGAGLLATSAASDV